MNSPRAAPTKDKNCNSNIDSNIPPTIPNADNINKEIISINDLDGIASERENQAETNKPYSKREVNFFSNNEDFMLQNRFEKKGNRLKEKAYEHNNSWNNISTVRRKDNSLMDSHYEDPDMSTLSNRDVLGKYMHLFGDADNYNTNNSRSNRSIYDTNRDDIVEGDITNMKLSNNSTSIQTKLQRINNAMTRKNLSSGRELSTRERSANPSLRERPVSFNSDLFASSSKGLSKK